MRLLLIFIHFEPIQIYSFTLTRIDSIAIGSLIAYCVRRDTLRSLLEKHLIITIIILLCIIFVSLLYFSSFNPLNNYFISFGYTMNALLFGSILLLAISKFKYNFLRMSLNNSFFRFFGKYSYAIYVFHFPVHLLFFNYFLSILNNKYFASICIIFITLCISIISWYSFESRILKLKKHFRY